MKTHSQRIRLSAGLIILGLLVLISVAQAETRQVEFRFELSAAAGSEFSAKLPVFSPGLLTVEAEWRLLTATGSAAGQTTLTLILLRPNGTEAARSSGASPLRFEMRISEQDLGGFGERERTGWTVKLINSAGGEDRKEVTGRLRGVVPITSGTLVDTDFELLGSANAKELPFTVSGPGRLTVEADWQTESPAAGASTPTSLSLILLHPGEDRVYARRQGHSPIRIEQQIAESALDRGTRFVARIENSAARVKGHLKVVFIPGS